MPGELLVIVSYRRQHGSAEIGAVQVVFVPGHTIDGDKKPTALSELLPNYMRQPCADGTDGKGGSRHRTKLRDQARRAPFGFAQGKL
jgi:hypothetical protein